MTTDPRFDGSHLAPPRRDQYAVAREELFGCCGPLTTDFEWVRPRPPIRPLPCPEPPPGVPFALMDTGTGTFFPLRVGLTAVGRFPENDIVLPENPISRRHCAVLVHATGGAEVHDTASRNGTRVNGRRIGRAWLSHGDLLQLCDRTFVFTARVRPQEADGADEPFVVGAAGDPPTGEWEVPARR